MAGISSVVLAMSMAAAGGLFSRQPAQAPAAGPAHAQMHTVRPGGRIMPDGPGAGWGFPNGNPDGYGWTDYSTFVPLGANRTADYYFPRYWSLLPAEMFLPSYYNPYESRGQRFIAYTGCGGRHPFGGPAPANSDLPEKPYTESAEAAPVVQPPRFRGRIEAPPIPSGASGLIP